MLDSVDKSVIQDKRRKRTDESKINPANFHHPTEERQKIRDCCHDHHRHAGRDEKKETIREKAGSQ